MDVRPLSARSIVLSLMLAVHPPELRVAELVALGEVFDVPESTMRAALTRLVATGDLVRSDGTHRIGERLLERQQRQDAALAPPYRPWDGAWETVVVVAPSRSAADRATWRAEMERLRLAELREGVWTRPANLDRPLPTWPAELVALSTSRPADVPSLVRRLWDLERWETTGEELVAALAEDRSPVERLAVAAALVRHLRTDPALPSALLRDDWNGPALAASYEEYQRELAVALAPVSGGRLDAPATDGADAPLTPTRRAAGER